MRVGVGLKWRHQRCLWITGEAFMSQIGCCRNASLRLSASDLASWESCRKLDAASSSDALVTVTRRVSVAPEAESAVSFSSLRH